MRLFDREIQKSESGVLRHELLNQAFLENKTAREFLNKMKIIIHDSLVDNRFKNLSISDLNELNGRLGADIKLPKFDDWDWFDGLGITIHDTYSTNIFLDDIFISSDKFKASISFQIQDHFGLDIDDVNGKGFENSPWFCSWFILQRYKDYGYKPFINEANFSVIIGS